MHDAVADYVHPILAYGMNLLERVETGAIVQLDKEQAALKKMLRKELAAKDWAESAATKYRGRNAVSGQDESCLLAIRYSLTCWLDELFIQHSLCSNAWAQRRLETALFGTNDGSWKFWKEAYQAQELPQRDVLEVLFLCVLFGFRGELNESPEKLRSWLVTAHDRLTSPQIDAWQPPAELEPATDVPPLRGLQKMKRMVIVCGMSLLVLIPIVVFMVAAPILRTELGQWL